MTDGSRVEERRLALSRLDAGVPDAAALLPFLADDDWRVRKDAAAIAAHHLADPATLRGCADALLQGEDVGLRNAAIEAFSLAPEAARPAVARALSDAFERAEPTARKFVCAALVGAGEAGLAILLREATSADAMTAASAVEALARIEGKRADEGLVAALAGDSQVVRLAALEGLVLRGARVSVETARLHLVDPLLRSRALELLGHSGDAAAIPLLVRALGESRTRTSATLGLHALASTPALSAAIGTAIGGVAPEAIAALVPWIDGADDLRAVAAAHVLLLARSPAVLGPLARLAVRAELPSVVLTALSQLGIAAVPPLLGALDHLEGAAAAWALEVAAELAPEAPPDTLASLRAAVRRALAGTDPQLLVVAAAACTAWAEEEDAARLVALGTHPDPRVAAAAGDALASLARRAPGSVEIALENEPNDALFSWSRGAIALPPLLALEKLKETLSGGDAAARRAAVEALPLIDGAEAAELAAMALADEDLRVRVAAVRTLSELRADDARALAKETFLVALRAPDAAVRAAAVRALPEGMVLDEASLARLAADEAPEVVAATVAQLRAGDPSATRVLELAAASADPEVQKELIRALLRVGEPRAQTWLVDRLAHPSWDVRREAAMALGHRSMRSMAARHALEARLSIEPDDLVAMAIHEALDETGEV